MQFFIGILPPDDIEQKIISFQKSFNNNEVPFIVEPHITIKAQSGLDENLKWLSKLKPIIKDFSKFTIKLNKVGDFNNKIIFLEPSFSKELINFHKKLFKAVKPGKEMAEKYFENDKYGPHLTLAWGLSEKELILMKQRAKKELLDFPVFEISFARIFKQDKQGEPYHKFLDIPLKI